MCYHVLQYDLCRMINYQANTRAQRNKDMHRDILMDVIDRDSNCGENTQMLLKKVK